MGTFGFKTIKIKSPNGRSAGDDADSFFDDFMEQSYDEALAKYEAAKKEGNEGQLEAPFKAISESFITQFWEGKGAAAIAKADPDAAAFGKVVNIIHQYLEVTADKSKLLRVLSDNIKSSISDK